MTTRTVLELAELCGATLEGDGARLVVGPASLAEATIDEVSFLSNPRYTGELEETSAGAVVVARSVTPRRDDLTLLRCENPSRAFSRVIEEFRPALGECEPGVHPTAIVEPDVSIGDGVSIGAGVFVGRETTLADKVVLHTGAIVGATCKLGPRTVVHAGCVLYPGTEVGADCLLHAGAVLGSDGFGFDPVPDGWQKVPQCGSVLVEDDVEIGANCTVDRGRFGSTQILRGSKLDNLVHVAHNVVVGPDALLVAQVGIAGSSRVGRRAILAGQVGVAGHVSIGDGAQVGGAASVFRDLEGGGEYWGTPAINKRLAVRSAAWFTRLPELAKRVKQLEKRLAELEGDPTNEGRA